MENELNKTLQKEASLLLAQLERDYIHLGQLKAFLIKVSGPPIKKPRRNRMAEVEARMKK